MKKWGVILGACLFLFAAICLFVPNAKEMIPTLFSLQFVFNCVVLSSVIFQQLHKRNKEE